MRKYFNYHRERYDEEFNTLVDCSLELARASFAGKKAADYEEKNRDLLAAIAKKSVENTPFVEAYEAEGLKLFHKPTVHNNQTVRDNFDAVIAQVVTAIVPEVVNEDFEAYIAEVHQIGWGDTARFIIESNDLFKVNSKAEGVRKGVDQPMYNQEYTVNPHQVEISTHIEWYPFAAGQFDMGNFALKIARSFEAYIFIKVVKGMAEATTKFGAGYTANGITPTLWGGLKAKVSAANGGMDVVAIGTEIALSNVHNTVSAQYDVAIGGEMNARGYLGEYLGVKLIALKNAMKPGTVNSAAPQLVLPDNRIYFIPVGGARPVKIVFEGNEVSVMYNPLETSDMRLGLTISLHLGIAVICGPKFGTITL